MNRREHHSSASAHEQRFRYLFERAPEGVFIATAEGRCTDVNDAGCRLLGYSRSELIGRSIVELVSPDDVPRQAELTRRLLEGGTEVSLWRMRRSDGSYVTTELGASALPDGHLMAFVRDISARQRIENEERLLAEVGTILISAGSDYQALLADVAQAMVRSHVAQWCSVAIMQQASMRRLRVVHADPAMAPVCERIERYAWMTEGPGPLPRLLESQQPALVEEVPRGYLEAVAQDAEHLKLIQAFDTGSLIIAPLIARGKTVGTLACGNSRALRRLNVEDLHQVERLANVVALAVDNALLHDGLERAVRARDEVLGIVAHDLRNPLSSIKLQAQTLRRRRGGPERRNLTALDSIQREAAFMNRLIQDLLDVVRLEAGQTLTVARSPVTLASVLADAVEQQQAALVAHHRTLSLSAHGLATVWADRARLLQVLGNLLGNAVKFARQAVTLAVSATEGEAVFEVGDDGLGIPSEQLPHLFDRFWQASRSDRRGAGLGLSIAKGIVEAHGGRIWVDSRVDQGTTVYFTMPTDARRQAAAGGPSPSAPAH